MPSDERTNTPKIIRRIPRIEIGLMIIRSARHGPKLLPMCKGPDLPTRFVFSKRRLVPAIACEEIGMKSVAATGRRGGARRKKSIRYHDLELELAALFSDV